jgi:hypothetical protein
MRRRAWNTQLVLLVLVVNGQVVPAGDTGWHSVGEEEERAVIRTFEAMHSNQSYTVTYRTVLIRQELPIGKVLLGCLNPDRIELVEPVGLTNLVLGYMLALDGLASQSGQAISAGDPFQPSPELTFEVSDGFGRITQQGDKATGGPGVICDASTQIAYFRDEQRLVVQSPDPGLSLLGTATIYDPMPASRQRFTYLGSCQWRQRSIPDTDRRILSILEEGSDQSKVVLVLAKGFGHLPSVLLQQVATPDGVNSSLAVFHYELQEGQLQPRRVLHVAASGKYLEVTDFALSQRRLLSSPEDNTLRVGPVRTIDVQVGERAQYTSIRDLPQSVRSLIMIDETHKD